ncbi:MAG: TetR/AcrR family transcriptional regulator [Gammaproteobacteria bacterium]|uniref:TetR/AcrR family transcriptional regulator n=1 Tax=Limnobacter sp. TaxID=2003368 RepID=UPI001DB75AF6|nr:TetR/AcrR family transcriptional regulator [Limnobacter sp.]MBU0782548.1 TetR/AcrR family transcriptional regulator [Gammaproteobacteria bacterium]MBU0850136.1 TetR/AcrR family transcriptional regulator [Gammaproteobacteria bacterium]MBU1268624.1 TetR/AcrR family transcriptional regulator [Gammaproteobacteria bacterium]MBU1530048.1 TetR/AcrR family transcriptional regulator [Gammaproteobacteria bacterium]MBU1780893.1 TetR/AcrR family transcriptional regulator [Gammaproteobacteria bacterium]
MPKKVQTRMKPEDRERQLIEVAQRMFIERGYQGTAMEDIAQAAGITRPVVYKLFGNKDGIYLACLNKAREVLNSYIIEYAMKGQGLEGRLKGGIEGYFSFVENERDTFRFLYDSGAAVAGPAAEAASKLRFDTVARIALLIQDLKNVVSDEEIIATAHALSGAGEQLAKWWLTQAGVPKAKVVNTMFNLLWAGLGQHKR